MKDFFIQCLKDLQPLTGIRQLHWLEQDFVDGPRQKDVLIDGMILAANEYPYIPDEVKMKVIREQMVKDQTYEELNSRVIHKWLNGIAGKYWIEKKEPTQNHPVASQETADYWAEEWKKELARVGQKVPTVTEDDTRKDPILKGIMATPKPVIEPSDPREEKIRAYVVKNIRKWIYNTPKRFWEIEGVRVPGDSEEEAREIYLNALN